MKIDFYKFFPEAANGVSWRFLEKTDDNWVTIRYQTREVLGSRVIGMDLQEGPHMEGFIDRMAVKDQGLELRRLQLYDGKTFEVDPPFLITPPTGQKDTVEKLLPDDYKYYYDPPYTGRTARKAVRKKSFPGSSGQEILYLSLKIESVAKDGATPFELTFRWSPGVGLCSLGAKFHGSLWKIYKRKELIPELQSIVDLGMETG
jgi:hypothetical protein